MENPIESIGRRYTSCVTRSRREGGCSLTLEQISSRVIIDGSKYQKAYRFDGRLCDRVVLCQDDGFILAAVELKGGKSTRITAAVEQIQGGLTLAEEVLAGVEVAGWLPLLLYSGHIHRNDVPVLRNRAVSFRGDKKPVVKEDCGASLKEITTRQRW